MTISKYFACAQGLGDEVDAETEEVLNEFSFLGSEEVGVGGEKSEDWSYSGGVGRGGTDDVSLGELAQLTVNNDADVSMDVSTTRFYYYFKPSLLLPHFKISKSLRQLILR